MKCKSDLRGAVLARRDALSTEEIAGKSRAAGEHLFSLPEFARARLVMFFVTFGSEIDTLPMMKQSIAGGQQVAAPHAERETRSLLPCEIMDPETDLAPGAYGIREPRPGCRIVTPDQIDVVLVPAAVWGQDGYRLGYGAGYYDRFLARAPRARRIGLGLEVQVVARVPHGDHDLPVDVLVTEAGVRRFAHRPAVAKGGGDGG
jgi:5-formyltetrahydrofolate cyclo-ligase